MPKTPPRGTPDDDLPIAARKALTATLEEGERIVRDAPAIGAHLLLTDRRLVVIREGFDFRPATGIRSWPLDRHLQLRVEPGRLLIDGRGGVVGVFYREPQVRAIRSLVAEIRRRTSTLPGE